MKSKSIAKAQLSKFRTRDKPIRALDIGECADLSDFLLNLPDKWEHLSPGRINLRVEYVVMCTLDDDSLLDFGVSLSNDNDSGVIYTGNYIIDLSQSEVEGLKNILDI
jgi:hypothetical protein